MRTLLAILLLSAPAFAQSRLLVGVTGGSELNNITIGPSMAAEVPFGPEMLNRIRIPDGKYDLGDEGFIECTPNAKCYTFASMHRFELDPSFQIGHELKLGYGSGWESNAKAGGIVWIKENFGMTSSVQYSEYIVTTASKTAAYLSIGPVWRIRAFQSPMRFSLGYVHQIRNGVSRNGTESSRLEGAKFRIDSRMGCTGAACWRLTGEFVVAHGRSQGNPVCDGTFGDGGQAGLAPCPRAGYVSGGATVGVAIEWPRRRGREGELF